MKLLLLLSLVVLFGKGLCALPAPLNPTVSSVNFKYELRWTAAPGSPPGVTYEVSVTCTKKWKKVISTKELRAEVQLEDPRSTYYLCVRGRLNKTHSPRSKTIFTPFLDTTITAPNVTMSGCGNCIWMNISLPKPHRKSNIKDIRDVYKKLLYNVSWRRQEQEDIESIEATNQTVIIPHLLPGTKYCVQVKPDYSEVNFQPSPWRCVFTSTVQPSQVFAAVGSVAGVVVFILFCLFLIFFGLQYTGIICKLKEALPHPLITSLWKCSLLRLERTVPEPVSLLPETGRRQHSHWDQDSEDQGTDQVDQMEDHEEDQYMNRCEDLSSDSSSESSHVTSRCQSATTVTDHPGNLEEDIEEQKDEEAQIIKNKDRIKEESKDCKDIEEWDIELDDCEPVNLFSITIAALDLQSDQEQCDEQPLLHTPCQSDIHQQLQESDTTDQQSPMNSYMRH